MASRREWTRQELLVAFSLYCRMPFGSLHSNNPKITKAAHAISRTPSALAMKLTNIASIDPEITSSGRRGLKNASTKDRSMWEEMQHDWEAFAINCEHAMSEIEEVVHHAGAEETDEDSLVRTGEDREARTTVRIGQAFFRSAVLSAYNGRCCITGLSVSQLLVAGHIIPWHLDKRNRVNPRNGLLLSVLHEKAFDIGLITINSDMTVRVARNYQVMNDIFFASSIRNYEGKPIFLPDKFAPEKDFLAFHREHVFQG